MGDVTRRSEIDRALAEVEQRLRSSAPSAAVRELRVRHSMLARVVRSWDHQPPHDAQVAAMLECVLDLQGMVDRACASRGAPSGRPPRARTTRPPPTRRDPSTRTTRPPARGPSRGSGPPGR